MKKLILSKSVAGALLNSVEKYKDSFVMMQILEVTNAVRKNCVYKRLKKNCPG